MALVPPTSRGSGGLARLSSTTLSGAGTFNIAISDATYSDLLVVIIARGTRAAVNDGLAMTFNGDATAANYDMQTIDYSGSALTGSNAFGTQGFFTVANTIPANSATASHFGAVECWIYGYAATTWTKEWHSLSFDSYTAGSGARTDFQAGMWMSTAAITSLQLSGQITANLATGSVVRVYGRQ